MLLSKKPIISFSLVLILILTSCTANAAQESQNTNTDQITATVTLSPTITTTTTITPTPLPVYELCSNIEDFRDCYVPVEELLDGSYWNWLNDVVASTLLPEFKEHEDKIKDVKVKPIGLVRGSALVYDGKTVPNFEDPETAPFKRDVTFASTKYPQPDGSMMNYYILPVFYYDKKIQQVYPVITLARIKVEGAIDIANKMYIEDMNITPIIFTETYGSMDKIVMTDPIVGQFFNKVGEVEMMARVIRFYDGDVSALSGPDMAFVTEIGKSDFLK